MNRIPPPSPRPTRSAAALRRLSIAALVVVPMTACGPANDDTTAASTGDPPALTDASVVPSPAPGVSDSESTVEEGPGTGSVSFGGPDAVQATVSMPAGYGSEGWYVGKRDSDPIIGLVFYDVGNIFSDPCRGTLLDPPVGPTVDELVTAFQDSTVFDVTPASEVTVDRFPGTFIEATVPDYDEAECMNFGLFKEDGQTDPGPDFWAQAPQQTLQMWILDVDGTRLVVGAAYYPDTPDEDRQALRDMVGTLDIGS